MKEKREGDGGRGKSVGKSIKKVKRDKKTAEKEKKTDKNRRWIKLALVRTMKEVPIFSSVEVKVGKNESGKNM